MKNVVIRTCCQIYPRSNHEDDLAGHSSFSFVKSRLLGTFFKGLIHNGIYNNTEFLQVERFKFVFFPLIQKELKDIKGNQNSHRIRRSLQSTNEGRPAGRMDIHYFVKENSSESLHKSNYDDFCLVKEDCCTDERNTIGLVIMNFLNLLLF